MASVGVLSCVILSLLNFVCGNVPVLLWESSKSDRINSFPALHRIKSEDYQQYILKKVHGEQPAPLMVVFLEESLSVEDFSWQDSVGQGYFPQLKYISETAANLEFLTSVQDSIGAMKGLTQFGYSLQLIDSDKTIELPDGCGKVLIVNLQEARPDEDRPELLRRHDVKIAEIYSQLLSKCSHVIGIFSGQQSSWVEPEEVSRLRRSAEGSDSNITFTSGDDQSKKSSENYTLFQDNNGFSLLFSSEPPKINLDGKDVVLRNYSDRVVVSGDNSKPGEIKLFAKYGSDYRVSFNFDNKTYGYWYLRTVTLMPLNSNPNKSAEIVLRSSQEICAPLGMSFHSSSKVVFRNGPTTLTFDDLQVQSFFLKSGTKAFDDAVHDIEFFTPVIWSGLFVTFLLGLIFTWGISMIMDIRTMDQFDDPKGKTITVSATE